METSKKRFLNISGIITVFCALGMVVLHVLQKQGLDSYIMPVVLLMFGILVLTRKPDEESRKLEIGKTAGRIVIATLSRRSGI